MTKLDDIRHTVCDVISTWAGIHPQHVASEHGVALSGGDAVLCSKQTFSGSVDGSCLIVCSKRFAEQLTTKLHGSANSADEVNDTLKELANVITGNILPKYFGRSSTLNLEELTSFSSDNLPAEGNITEFFTYDGDMFGVYFSYKTNQNSGDKI